MKNSPCRPSGFALVELMVTITIVVVLAALAMFGFRRARDAARMAANISNLRNVGQIVTTIAQDRGSYPPGWSWSRGESWATLVVRELHGDDALQDETLLSPVVARSIPSHLDHETISNYSVNPFIFSQQGYAGERAYQVSPSRLRRPSEQILLGDGLPRAENAPYGFTMIVWWALRTGTGNGGTPPVSSPSRASTPIDLPSGIQEMTHDGGKGLPAFRNRGRGHFLFADGHAEALLPEELKYRHFALSY